jgi:hypothetical protein
VKQGRYVQHLCWFYDHSKSRYYKGFQNITCVWSNIQSAIPIDFELKIGKKLTKHSRKSHHRKGSMTDQVIIDFLSRDRFGDNIVDSDKQG